MALEGSLVLPVFLFFMMTILLSLEAVRLQSNVMEALHQAGNSYAFAGYQIKYEHQASPDVRGEVKEYLASQLYPALCVAGEEEGIVLEDVSDVCESGRIELKVSYGLKPFISWIPVGEIMIQDRFVSHGWIGYTGMETPKNSIQEIYVYVTETGSKYHASYNCTYLRVQVQSISYENIFSLRNQSGEKYYACARCKPGNGGVVYFSAGGSSYHSQSDCSALKRTVYMIPLSQANGYGACSKCVGKGEGAG